MKNTKLFVIDPQNDFMDIPGASLPVPGAERDMCRLSDFIGRHGAKLTGIYVTLDTHQTIDVGHPHMWVNQSGERPAPFTVITPEAIEEGIWASRNPTLFSYMIRYARALRAGG